MLERTRLRDDCHCHWCGMPLYRGDVLLMDTDTGRTYCSKQCRQRWENEYKERERDRRC